MRRLRVRAAKEVGHSPQFRAAVLLASAWAFDEGSKSAARMIAKIPDQILLPFLDRVALDGIDLGEMGQRLLEYADKHDVSLGDVESIKPRVLSDIKSLEKSLIGALSRASRRQARAESDREHLAPFEVQINRLIAAYRKDKPNRRALDRRRGGIFTRHGPTTCGPLAGHSRHSVNLC